MDRDEIIRVLRAFEAAGLEYVLIGATAIGFHGLVRATEDVDLIVRATPDNLERLRQCARYWAIAPRMYPRRGLQVPYDRRGTSGSPTAPLRA